LPAEIQLSPILQGHATEVLTRVRHFEFEGVVAKRLDSIYRPGEKPGTWQKVKTQRTDDFWVGGYITGNGGVDELVVGEKRGNDLYFVASVKNGFVPATRRRVLESIARAERAKCPFVNLPEKKGLHRMDREKMRKVRWLRPTILCEVAFNERTAQGHLRHSKFLRLREPADVKRKAQTG
jgi:bifunctional non-homologous end joining protein LigD